MYDNTVIMVMNDHGMGSKNMLVEHGARIMNFIRYPPEFGKNGYMLPSDFVVNTEDVASVIFDLAEIELDTEFPDYIIDGKDWLPDVVDYIDNIDNGITRDYDINPPDCCQERISDVYNSHTIIQKKYKYIYRAAPLYENRGTSNYPYFDNEEQLYDLENDGAEQNNLVNDITYQDILFEFRVKMIDYIHESVCYTDNTDDCVVPYIDYIPADSSYTRMPTPAPTTSAPTTAPTAFQECRDILYWNHTFPGIRRFSEKTSGNMYRYQAENQWLNITNQSCGDVGDFSDIEYLYLFIKQRNSLDLSMIICCQGSFALNFTAPLGYKGNEVYDNQHGIIGDLDIEEVAETFGLKELLVINIVVICCLIICLGIGCRWYFKKRISGDADASQLAEIQETKLENKATSSDGNGGDDTTIVTKD